MSQTLKRSSHADLLHRINMQFSLHPMPKDKTPVYIDARIKKAGGQEKIFETAAKELIHDYTGGVPRQVNNVATACLLNAAASGTKIITEAMVNETMSEFHLP